MTTTTKSLSLSPNDRDLLIKGAFEAKSGAYIPYSNFRVGAALLSTDGVLIKGANIENASYGGTICAERTAIVKAVSEGIRSFVGLAVTTDKEIAISPCGICRQVIREFCSLQMPILLVPANYYDASAGPSGETRAEIRETTLDELLPDSFGPEHLELPSHPGSVVPKSS